MLFHSQPCPSQFRFAPPARRHGFAIVPDGSRCRLSGALSPVTSSKYGKPKPNLRSTEAFGHAVPGLRTRRLSGQSFSPVSMLSPKRQATLKARIR